MNENETGQEEVIYRGLCMNCGAFVAMKRTTKVAASEEVIRTGEMKDSIYPSCLNKWKEQNRNRVERSQK